MPAPHCSVFTGRMPFLPPNQQCQSTEGNHSTQTNDGQKTNHSTQTHTSTPTEHYHLCKETMQLWQKKTESGGK